MTRCHAIFRGLAVVSLLGPAHGIPLSAQRPNAVTFPYPAIQYRFAANYGCEKTACDCNYGQWRVLQSLPVYSQEGDTTQVAFHLKPGDTLSAEGGFVHVLRPAVVFVHDTAEIYVRDSVQGGVRTRTLLPGDTLYVLHHVGEGQFKGWYKGDTVDFDYFWNDPPEFGTYKPAGRLVLRAQLEWWVEISTAAGPGWLKVVDHRALRGPSADCPRL